ncbi:hypothetical protein [Methyloprofundus sp.]|uniref:hypothetical protein n=1 Tax=Methyloprofundus sp. TaxID=2020875 RepID=UPI003D12F4E1
MANTERLKVIQIVRQAKKSAGSARFDVSISSKKRKELEKLYIKLDEIEDMLILEEITNKVDALTQASTELEVINDNIRKNIKELEGIAEMVGRAANAVKILVVLAVQAAAIVA